MEGVRVISNDEFRILNKYLTSKRFKLKDQSIRSAFYVSTYSVLISLILKNSALALLGIIFTIQIIKYFYKIDLKKAAKFYGIYLLLIFATVFVIALFLGLFSVLFLK